MRSSGGGPAPPTPARGHCLQTQPERGGGDVDGLARARLACHNPAVRLGPPPRASCSRCGGGDREALLQPPLWALSCLGPATHIPTQMFNCSRRCRVSCRRQLPAPGPVHKTDNALTVAGASPDAQKPQAPQQRATSPRNQGFCPALRTVSPSPPPTHTSEGLSPA